MTAAAAEGPRTWTAAPPRWGWPDALALGCLAAAVAWVFRDVLFQGRALFYFDITEINLPYRDFLAREWRAGRFSRWHPGLYCGMALFSESQAGYLHFLKPLYLLLPTWRAFALDTVLSVLLTALASYGWLRRHVGPAGALTGAAVFGLGGFVWAHLVHTSMINALISVPVVLWALETTWSDGRWRGAAVGALALASQVFAGHLQDSLLTGTLVLLYGLHRGITEQGLGRRAFAIGSAGALVGMGVLIAAVQWVPSKELIDRSPRAAGIPWEELTYGSWHPELLPTLVVREAYGTRARDTDWMDGFYPYHEMNTFLGVIALGLAVVGGAAWRDRWVVFWVIVAGLALAMMLGRFTFLFDRMTDVPFLGRGRVPVRYHLWFSAAIAALAAVGVDRLARPGAVSLRGAFALVAALAAASLPILAHVYLPIWTEARRWTSPYNQVQFVWLREDITGGAARLAVLGGLAGFLAHRAARSQSPRVRAALAGCLPLLVVAELLAAHRDDVPTVPASYWTDPPASAEFILADAHRERVVGGQERSVAEPGYASGSRRFFEEKFFKARETLSYSMAPVWGLRSAEGVTPIVPTRFLAYGDNVRVGAGRYDIESVTHVVSTRNDFIGLGVPEPAGTLYVYRNPEARPRVRLMGEPFYAADRVASVRAAKAIGAAIRDRLVVEDPGRPLAEGTKVEGAATLDVDLPERLEITVDAKTPTYLFISDTFDPGWSATVDGRPVPVRPAQINFRAIFVPEGRHRVVLTYEPAGFRLGLTISLAGLALGGVMLAWPRRVVSLAPEHDENDWPRGWPWALLGALVVLVMVSAIGLGPSGPTVHSRWDGSWHRFTWSAGIEAMRPPPPPIE